MSAKSLHDFCMENKNKKYLLDEWNFLKNELSPTDVVPGSRKKVWWKGICGHEWQSAIYSRTRKEKTGCPYCMNKKILVGYNDLATTHPELAKEWHSTKNGDLKPTEVITGSHQKVWWICDKGHSWETSVVDRIRGNNCPYCSNKKILVGFNDLATTDHELAKEWHPTKNGELKPTDVVAGSKRKVWWICEHSHEWASAIQKRKSGNNCPYCSNRKILTGYNDLATTHPELAKEWNFEKNKIKPTEVSAGSGEKVWWKCKEGHEWKTTIVNRKSGNNCPHCSGSQTSVPETMLYLALKSLFKNVHHRYKLDEKEFDIYVKDISLLIEYDGNYYHKDRREKDKRKNEIAKQNCLNFLRIWEYSERTKEKQELLENKENLYFKSDRCNYKNLVETVIQHINENYDTNVKYVPKENEEQLAREHIKKEFKENSLAVKRPEIAAEWHPTKNGILTPYNFSYGSESKVWWKCEKGHEWETTIKHRIHGGKCPICSNKKIVAGINDFPTTCSDLFKYWDFEKNTASPTTVSKGSHKKYYWINNEESYFSSPKDARRKYKID